MPGSSLQLLKPEVDDVFYYRSKGDDQLVCQILARSNDSVYIHYSGMDKREDEWIHKSDLGPLVHPSRLPPETPGRREEQEADIPQVRNIDQITFGRWMIDAWYHSPYPFDLIKGMLWVCPCCLLYFTSSDFYKFHCGTCSASIPGTYFYSYSWNRYKENKN